MKLLAAGTVLGNYTIQNKIGEGGSACVYSAVGLNNEIVVLKCFALKTFLNHMVINKTHFSYLEYKNEVSILKKCKNPNLVNMHHHYISGSLGVIVLDKMDMDLVEYIQTEKMSISDSKTIFKQICCAVLALHNMKIAHMDIKPDNIFMNDADSVRLGDFGSCIAWTCGNSGVHLRLSEDYSGPEFFGRAPCIPAKADVWSLGILLHIILTGFLPIRPVDALEKCELDKDKLPDDESLFDLFEKILQVNPKERPTVAEILDHPWFEQPEYSQPDTKIEEPLILPQKLPSESSAGDGDETDDSYDEEMDSESDLMIVVPCKERKMLSPASRIKSAKDLLDLVCHTERKLQRESADPRRYIEVGDVNFPIEMPVGKQIESEEGRSAKIVLKAIEYCRYISVGETDDQMLLRQQVKVKQQEALPNDIPECCIGFLLG